MLKHRIIGSFVAVWCAVCLLYVGARAACGVMPGKTTNSEAANTTATKDNSALEEERPTTSSATVQDAPNEQPAAEESLATQKPTEQIEDAAPELSEPNSANTQQDVPEVQTEEGGVLAQEAQEIEASSIPTLSEYLSSYTCGSCRRNCTLDNPRCHNGSRLAEVKAQEYYELYG